ncbi:Uncharacterised protein [Faecalicoccus pleomorphus]|uniref:Uncharacterized protein n=1 Tax=Faecalicoccus pleomorphus TaxID=1323 RepID=A0A380LKF6_9FIRM|nr:Uncharacterised protein [Faecalicoccus pleomorphus]
MKNQTVKRLLFALIVIYVFIGLCDMDQRISSPIFHIIGYIIMAIIWSLLYYDAKQANQKYTWLFLILIVSYLLQVMNAISLLF